jgi:hydroxypyruvate reductase
VPVGPIGWSLLAVGKGASAMASGAMSAAGDRIERVLVVQPSGMRPPIHPGIELLEAAHPDPDGRSVAAARRALDLVRESDFTLALISGGASSLLCLPREITLARYVRAIRALLLGGATVRDVNVVRRHLCAVKGGGLARVAAGPVRTLIASDVIGGGPHDVGSGPTLPDPTTCAQARAVLRRYAPRFEGLPLRESLKPTSVAARRLKARIIARPEHFAHAVAEELRARDFSTKTLEPSVAPAADLAREYIARARTLRPGQALVRAAEPSLRIDVPRPGRGGRSTHLAALVGRELPEGVAFMAGASDGVDGVSGTAGAIVDASLAAYASPDAIARAIARFDTAPLLVSAGMALLIGPTGNNLGDVHVLVRALS